MTPRTTAQITASRTNGALSHGPATPEGKARSARNATTHGLWSRKVVLATEDPEEFAARLAAASAAWPAATPELVHELVATEWRLRRVQNLETSLLNQEIRRLLADEESVDGNDDDATTFDGRQLTALAWRNLLENGTLRQLDRQETRLSRAIARIAAELRATHTVAPTMMPVMPVSPAPAARGTNPGTPAAPPPTPPPPPVPTQILRNEAAPQAAAPAPKRPTYDKNGRRILYHDLAAAA